MENFHVIEFPDAHGNILSRYWINLPGDMVQGNTYVLFEYKEGEMEPSKPLNPIKKMLVLQVKSATTRGSYKIFDILAEKAKLAADNHHDTAFNADTSSRVPSLTEPDEEKVDGGGRRTRRKKRKKRKKRKSRRNKKRKKSKKIKSRRRKSSGRK